jgi:hypothetical protein
MRAMALVLGLPFLAPAGWAAGEHRGRDLAIRGMRMEAHHRPNRRPSYRGWDLVAQGLAILMSQPGEWEKSRGAITGDIIQFLRACAKQARLPSAYLLHDIADDWWRPQFCRRRGHPLVLVEIPYRDEANRGPEIPACQMLIGEFGGRMITSAIRQVREESDQQGSFLVRQVWDVGCWVSEGRLWAVLAGCYTEGGTGTLPSAVVLRSAGARWRIVSRVDWGGSTHFDGFSLDDVNHDGIPELVCAPAHRTPLSPIVWTPMDYTLYKLIGHRYERVWHADLESLEAQLTRFFEGITEGRNGDVLAATASDEVLHQARRLGLWKRELWWEISERHEDLPRPYAIATTGDERYRLDLVRPSRWRWRISGIRRAP